ncbi:MAG: hypothetical protein Q8L48_05145 [Archangium sp.]|nr:hypothetical protein [Archangium sp.]
MTGLLLIAALQGALGAEPQEARAQAAAHFERAERFFEEGRYPESIREFEAAYALAPHPALLFNLGKCHERMGDLAGALGRYRAYVKALPEADDVELVRSAIAELERLQRERGPAVSDMPRTLTLTGPKGRLWTWVLAGAAGAGLLTGAGLGFGAVSAREEMLRVRHGALEVQQLHDAAAGRAAGANIAYGLAGAAAVTALILFFFEPREAAGSIGTVR